MDVKYADSIVLSDWVGKGIEDVRIITHIRSIVPALLTGLPASSLPAI